MNIHSVVSKISSYEDLNPAEIEFIINYIFSNPKLKAYIGITKNMIKKYQSSNISDRTILSSQLKRILPSIGYIPTKE